MFVCPPMRASGRVCVLARIGANIPMKYGRSCAQATIRTSVDDGSLARESNSVLSGDGGGGYGTDTVFAPAQSALIRAYSGPG